MTSAVHHPRVTWRPAVPPSQVKALDPRAAGRRDIAALVVTALLWLFASAILVITVSAHVDTQTDAQADSHIATHLDAPGQVPHPTPLQAPTWPAVPGGA